MSAVSYKQTAVPGFLRKVGTLFALQAVWLSLAFAGPLEDATAAFERAQYATAIRILKGSGGASANASFLLGRAHFQMGDFDAAAKALEAAVAANASNSRFHNWLGRAYGMQAENANPFSAMGLARKARGEFEKAVSLDGSNLEAKSDLFSFYLAAPGFLGGGMDKAEALAATVEKKNAAEFAGMQAQLAEKKKDYGEAEQHYRKAIEADPSSIGRHIDLAKFYTRRGLADRADAALTAAKKVSPGAPRLLFDEANLLARSERKPDVALALLRRYEASTLTPDDPSPYDVQQLRKKLEKLKK